MISIGCKSLLLKHLMSFRHYVYIIQQDNLEEYDLYLNFHHDEFNYVIFETLKLRLAEIAFGLVLYCVSCQCLRLLGHLL